MERTINVAFAWARSTKRTEVFEEVGTDFPKDKLLNGFAIGSLYIQKPVAQDANRVEVTLVLKKTE